eukprot:294169-Chlamydomonas_euryale.AAC.3
MEPPRPVPLLAGGAFKRVLHDPGVPPRVALSKEQYTSGRPSTTRNHFDEKLVKLKVWGAHCRWAAQCQ